MLHYINRRSQDSLPRKDQHEVIVRGHVYCSSGHWMCHIQADTRPRRRHGIFHQMRQRCNRCLLRRGGQGLSERLYVRRSPSESERDDRPSGFRLPNGPRSEHYARGVQTVKLLAMSVLIVLSGYAIADVFPQGDQGYKCITTGGFFDFSPNGAIETCRNEIDEFCKSKSAPPLIGKTTGEPSGFGRYAKAEISFQCTTVADIEEVKKKQVRAEIESSKQMCQQDFGFVPNTPEFSNCLLELQKQHFNNRRVAQEVAAQKEISEDQLAQKRQSDADQSTMNAIQSINKMTTPAPVRNTDCTTYGRNISCTTR